MLADLGRGVLAGLTATVVLSLLMVFRLSMGIMTEFQPIEILNLAANELLGTPDRRFSGWVMHFFVGVVLWGVLFALWSRGVAPRHSGLRQGLLFGTLAWLLLMIVVMPLAGSGLFGLGFGLAVPIMTLLAHLVYGAVLGWGFHWLRSL
ncbi:DUF6789 family protein [Alkalilimnicola sp. S0819]|uniref:DUF6789 family protein n=1 Tax=Alkalilimnicola sp. S0819 TaxID=2613922 RepID=UPI001261765A|nr:DUF6789 family protein [Alkalilimnicola sp. S0819]KAB7623961.1 hypothetical protein F3N43_07920 [Alkalilimnicola sp. S0819]MPQ16562.1 hypothetical protein [Alkalilimnicola sp. S0819]